MTILLTGSCGYIGSHVALWLNKINKDFIGLDNLSAGQFSNNYGPLVVGDIRKSEDIEQVFEEAKLHGQTIDAVIHMAALTSVPESMEKKDEYEEVNYEGTSNIIKIMKKHNCHKLIFSSTASVYKQSNEPVKESDPIEILNNYALTKYASESLIKANKGWLDAVIFRYFNVIGYDENYDKSKELLKTNLVPSLLKSLNNHIQFTVFGNCYPVKRKDETDHTCVRDYIDVRDIARAHGDALAYLDNHPGQHLFNLGTKLGYSVLELIKAFEQANDTKLDYAIVGPRKGDPASIIADNQKARELLHWCPLTPLKESLRVIDNSKQTYNNCYDIEDKSC